MNSPAPARHALCLRCPPLPVVRIGMVGLGRRGMKTLERYAFIDGAVITMLADRDPAALRAANDALRASGRPAAATAAGDDGWRTLCRSRDVDLLYICTDWQTHCAMAVEAMEQGKHVAVEVPAATTVDECWTLVRTAERTRRHLFMTENCCYDFFALATGEMAAAGQLGTLTHCEGAYLHDLRSEFAAGAAPGESHWMARGCTRHGGNPYPTHGLGPIGWLLGLHRGDRMDYLVSLTTGRAADPLQSRVSTTLIRTVRGAGIMLQLDVTTPRPYSRLQTVCGTQGFVQKYPLATLQLGDAAPLTGPAAEQEAARHATGPAARLWLEGRDRGVPNAMNYAMDARLIHCLRHGLPLDIDVYDAAEWSCIAELSQLSAREGSRPVAIPDFTSGHWEELPGHRFF